MQIQRKQFNSQAPKRTRKESLKKEEETKNTNNEINLVGSFIRKPYFQSIEKPIEEIKKSPSTRSTRSARRLFKSENSPEKTDFQEINQLQIQKEESNLDQIFSSLQTNLAAVESIVKSSRIDLLNQMKQMKLDYENKIEELQKENIQLKQQFDKNLILKENNIELFKLNVGGTHELMTTNKILCQGLAQGTKLERTFGPIGIHSLQKIDDKIFIDRDGKVFELLINYLRNEGRVFPKFTNDHDLKMFVAELEFWQIKNQLTRNNSLQTQNNIQAEQKMAKQESENFDEPPLESTSNMIGLGDNYDQKYSKKLSGQASNQQMISELKQSPQRLAAAEMQYSNQRKVNLRPNIMWPSNENIELTPQKKNEETPDNFEQNYIAAFGREPEDVTEDALEKWRDLGPLALETIQANSDNPINKNIEFILSPYQTGIFGQHQQPPEGSDAPDPLTCTGIGRESEYGIYEGQYIDDEWNGFGRRIIANGDYYIGQWRDGMRNGWGRYVYNQIISQQPTTGGIGSKRNLNTGSVSSSQAGSRNGNQQLTFVTIEEGLWVDDEFQGQQKLVSLNYYQDIMRNPFVIQRN